MVSDIIALAVVIVLIVSIIPYRKKSKDVIFRNQKAKKFFVTPFAYKSFLPYSIYTTEDGIWIGRFYKIFYPFSDIQSGVKGTYFTLSCLKSKDFPYFFTIRGGQKEELFEILRGKGVKIEG